MNKYSKIKLGKTHKSRSMDFSDLQSYPHENFTIPIESTSPKNSSKPREPNQINSKNTHLPDLQEEEEQVHVNSNGSDAPNSSLPKLTRNGSVSSSIKAVSKRFKLENNNKQSSSPRTTTIGEMQSVVKRAFSMRRSSSVSERYCRIHDQCVTLPSPLHDGDDDFDEDSDVMQTSRSVEKKKKKQGYSSGRLFKACKRFLKL